MRLPRRHRRASTLPLTVAAAVLLFGLAAAAWPPSTPPSASSTPATRATSSASATQASTSATSSTTSDDTSDEADADSGELPWLVGALWEPFTSRPSIVALDRPEGDFVYVRDRGWLKWDGRDWAAQSSVPGDLQKRYPRPEQRGRDECVH